MCLLVSAKTRVLALTKRHMDSGNEIGQIWLVPVSLYCVCKANQNRNLIGPVQRSLFLVLTKRSVATGDENVLLLYSPSPRACSFDQVSADSNHAARFDAEIAQKHGRWTVFLAGQVKEFK